MAAATATTTTAAEAEAPPTTAGVAEGTAGEHFNTSKNKKTRRRTKEKDKQAGGEKDKPIIIRHAHQQTLSTWPFSLQCSCQ